MTTTNHTLFEEYLRGTLLGEEKKKLELLFSTNGEEKEKFDIYRIMRRTLKPSVTNPAKEQELREHLDTLRKKYTSSFLIEEDQESKVKKSLFGRRIMGVAASVTFFLCALIGTVGYSHLNFRPQALAQASFEAPKYVSGDKSADLEFTTEELKYIAALEAYKNSNYSVSESEALLLINSETRSIREDAQWLIIMNKLSVENVIESKVLLHAIASDPQHNYSANAQALLDKLNSTFFKIGNLF